MTGKREELEDLVYLLEHSTITSARGVLTTFYGREGRERRKRK
jgi:hypothetical protein